MHNQQQPLIKLYRIDYTVCGFRLIIKVTVNVSSSAAYSLKTTLLTNYKSGEPYYKGYTK